MLAHTVTPNAYNAQYTLATKSNSTRSTLSSVDKVERVEFDFVAMCVVYWNGTVRKTVCMKKALRETQTLRAGCSN